MRVAYHDPCESSFFIQFIRSTLFPFKRKSIMQNFLFTKTSCKQFCVIILFFNLLSCCLYRCFQIRFFYCIMHLKFYNNCRITIISFFSESSLHHNGQIHFLCSNVFRKYPSALQSIQEQIHDKTVLVHFCRLPLHLHQNN